VALPFRFSRLPMQRTTRNFDGMRTQRLYRSLRSASGLTAIAAAMLIGGCPPQNSIPDPAAVELGIEIAVPNEGATHFPTGTDLTYDSNPPASGPHWPNPAQPGFYDTRVPTEQWVHNLEHGYVVILFDCRGKCDAALLQELQDFAATAPASAIFGYAKIVVTPYDGLPENALLAAIAWDVQLFLDAFDQAALLDFFNRHQDQGPERAG
jgi:hypothetical protein